MAGATSEIVSAAVGAASLSAAPWTVAERSCGMLASPNPPEAGPPSANAVLGAILAATFVALPFYVIAVEGALRTARREIDDLEGVASTLGAPPLTVLRRITLPRLLPAMGAGLALAWARALGEFGATITFAGNLPGRTQTLPLATFLALQSEPERALALSLVMLAVALAVLLPLRDRWLPGR